MGRMSRVHTMKKGNKYTHGNAVRPRTLRVLWESPIRETFESIGLARRFSLQDREDRHN